MKTKILLIVMLTFSCLAGRCETTNAPLKFYIVSELKIEGGKFIETPTLPNGGYISATPDLVVTNLLAVGPQKKATTAFVDGKVVPVQPLPGLGVELQPGDAKRFAALTERALGKRLLIALGNKPLRAPKVVTPIQAGRFTIDFGTEEELQKTQAELKKLIPAR